MKQIPFSKLKIRQKGCSSVKNLEKKEKLWKLLEETKQELLTLCSELIRRPSVNPPIDPKEITDFITGYFDQNGIDYEVIYNHPQLPIILANVGKKGGRVLCINGHTDTVPPGDLSKWDFDPYCGTITDTQVCGRGASDMLCGVAIGMHIAKLIKQHNIDVLGQIRLHLVSDEESGGDYCSKFLAENGYADDIDALMLPEPTTYNNVETGSKGSIRLVVHCCGKQVHGSICSFAGEDNAMKKMVKILSSMEDVRALQAHFEEHQLEVVENSKQVARDILKVEGVGEVIDHVTYNVSYLKTGDETHSPAEYCEAGIGFGIPNGIATERVRETIENIVKRLNLPDVELEYKKIRYATYTPVSEEIVQTALENANYLWGPDKKVVPVYQWATSDGKYYRLAGVPSIQYGPANIDGVHGYSECADIEEIVNCVKTYLGVIVDFLGVNI